jgi:hypothetical protein
MSHITDTLHNSIECHFAECRDFSIVMLSVIILNVVMPRAVILMYAESRGAVYVPVDDMAIERM